MVWPRSAASSGSAGGVVDVDAVVDDVASGRARVVGGAVRLVGDGSAPEPESHATRTTATNRTAPRRARGVTRQTRSSSSMRIALPRSTLYAVSSSSPESAIIFSTYSFEFGHVVSVCG